MYNTQTSTQQHHLNSVHKEFEKEKLIRQHYLTDSQPFNLANGEGFLCMINKLDPAFKPLCYVMIKKNIGYGYQAAFQTIKEMITYTCDIFTENMELYDILICVTSINYPHNSNNIRQTILTKLQLLGLDSKVNVAITNNGSNMIKAIHKWDASWKRLQVLKDPIKQVLLNLYLENEFKKDYKKLKTRILLDYKWILLKKLIVPFKPTEEATEWLGDDNIINESETVMPQINSRNNYSTGGFKSCLFGSYEIDENNDEINCYLDNFRTPQAIPEMDPFQ
ncbi:18838_t:CDS:2, partial [Funneliformis geosporum]